MNKNIDTNTSVVGSQTQVLEIPSSLKMIEISKTYLANIEKKFGVFLHKLGIDIGNYDGNLEGNSTGAEKIFQEKILPLQEKIEKEKHSLKKQDLINQLTQSILEAKGIDIKEIQKLALNKGKEKEFQKEFGNVINENNKIKSELENELNKLDGTYIVEASVKNIDKKEKSKELGDIAIQALKDYNEGIITKVIYENIILKIMGEAQKLDIEYEVTHKIGKFFELGMQSGTIPIAMMMTPKVKACLPMLPSVIGIGIWARAYSLTASNQSVGEKTIEGGKIIGETALTIAPITGTYMAGKETWEAYERYQAGNGSGAEVIANGIGTGVSLAFDGVTVFLVATGIGTVPAVGLQALRATVKEAVKGGAKKIISMIGEKFSKEGALEVAKVGAEKITQNTTENIGSKTPGFINTTKEFLKGKINFISSAYKELGPKEYLKRAVKQGVEDTATGLWDIVTLKGIRDTELLKKLPEKLQFFERGKKASAGWRANIVESLENVGLAKKGMADKIRAKGTASEFRVANDEANDLLRNDNGATQVEDIHAKFKEELSTKNFDGSLKELKEMVLKHDGTTAEFNAVLSSLKTQDEYMGNALNILTKLDEKLSKHSGNNEKLISEIEIILNENKGKVSKSLYEYLESILSRVKSGENFGAGTGNHIELLNKISGKVGIEKFKGGKGYEEYEKMLQNGAKESENGYIGNYQKSLKEMSKLLFSGEIRGERAESFVKEFLEILKNAEKTGWGTIRLETMAPGFAGQSQKGKMKNGYEGMIQSFLNAPKHNVDKIEHIFIKNIDLSLIHNIEIKEQIVNRVVDVLKSKKLNFEDEMSLIRHIGFYDDYKAILKEKLAPDQKNLSNKPKEVTPESTIGEYHIVNRLTKKAKENDDIMTLLDYIKNDPTKKSGIPADIGKKIFQNLEKLDFGKMSKAEIDSTLTSLGKLGDNEAKKGFDIIIKKLIPGKLSIIEKIPSFMTHVNSYENNALLCKVYPERSKEIINGIIKSNDDSIEYKIRFISELENKKVVVGDDCIADFALHLIQSTDEVAFISKIDQIEVFFKENKLSGSAKAALEYKITELKESDLYKANAQNNGKTFVELVDKDRNFSDRDIKDLKNNGTITYKTLADIDQVIKDKCLRNLRGEIKTEYSPVELEKLKIVREKVKTALENYELNLFNHGEYKSKMTDSDKVSYLFKKIDEMTGEIFEKGGTNTERLNRNIVKQLNVIKTNFQVEPHIIDGFLYEVLKSTKIQGFNIGEKLKLLNDLEIAGVIKPSVEKKQEYIINLQAKTSDELREFSYAIKEYSKDFEQLLSGSNSYIKELKLKQDKSGILRYVKQNINDRVPVDQAYIDSKPELTKGIDYVTIEGKIYITEIYPARYFITQLLNAKDLKQKETYMELIHNKTDFGGKNFREYFDEVKAKGDIETMLLMSYHDDIKYDKDVIDLLKSSAEEHKNLVMYVLGKRKDYDIIIGNDINTGGSNNINNTILKQTLTKKYVEGIEGRKLSDEEYGKIKYGIEKMFQLQKDPMFQKMLLSAKGNDDLTQEDGLLKPEYKELILKYSDIFENVFKEINTKKQSVTELLNTIDGKKLMLVIKGFGDRYQDKTKKATSAVGESIKSIKSLLSDASFRRNIVSSVREGINIDYIDGLSSQKKSIYSIDWLLVGAAIVSAIDMLKDEINSKDNIIIKDEINSKDNIIIKDEINSKVEINSKSVKMSSEISGSKVSIDDYKLPNDLRTKLMESFGKIVNLKTLFGILITFGIMTPKDAQAAAEEIGDKWKKTPQYEKYLKLGGENSAEAKKLKEEAISGITKEVLAIYIQSFDPKYQELMDKKVKELPNGLQTLLGNIDIKLKEKIKPGYDTITISKLNNNIFNFVDSIYKGKGLADKNLTDIVTKFPELNGTNIVKTLGEIAKGSDNIAESQKNIDARDKIIEKLKKI